MGLSIRVFIVEDDDSIKRLPLAQYERLLERDPMRACRNMPRGESVTR